MSKRWLLVCLFFVLTSCSQPPAKASYDGKCWNIDLTRLGEYTLRLGVIELRNQNSQVVWSVKPRPGKVVRIGGIELCRGINDIRGNAFVSLDEVDFIPKKETISLSDGLYELFISSPEFKDIKRIELSFEART